MNLISVKPNTKEWHHFRRTHIGASDAPIIMGISPWKKPIELYEEKVFKIMSEENEAMKRGKELEEVALENLEREIGIDMFPMVGVHENINWMSASFDGMTIERDMFCEIKCPGKTDHNQALKGKIPKKYFPQLQHQLFVSGLENCLYYSFDGEKGKVIEVRKDEKYIEEMIKKENGILEMLTNFETSTCRG